MCIVDMCAVACALAVVVPSVEDYTLSCCSVADMLTTELSLSTKLKMRTVVTEYWLFNNHGVSLFYCLLVPYDGVLIFGPSFNLSHYMCVKFVTINYFISV